MNTNDVPILVRREIEARIAGPLIKAFMKKFGREETIAVASEVILNLAEESGQQLAERCGGSWWRPKTRRAGEDE